MPPNSTPEALPGQSQRRPFTFGSVEGLQLFQLIRFASLLLISILLAKSPLELSDIGAYESFLFFSSLFVFFWINGLIQGLLSSSARIQGSENSSLLFNSFLLLLMAGALGVLILFLAQSVFPAGAQSGIGEYLPLLAVYTLLSGPSALVEHIYLLQGRTRAMTIYGIASYFFQVLFVSLPAFFGGTLLEVLLGLVASSFLRIFWLMGLLARFSKFVISFPFLRQQLQTSWPLILSALAGGLTTYYDGFMVNRVFDSETFAIFRYGARELPFVVLLANAFSNAMVAKLAGEQDKGALMQEIRRKSLRMAHWLFPLTILLMLGSPWLFASVFNPQFSPSSSIFNLYLLILTSRLLFPQTLLIAYGQGRWVMWNTLWAAIFHAILVLVFIITIGLEGVALAAVLSNLFEKGLQIRSVKKCLGIKMQEYVDVFWYLMYGLVLIMIFLGTQFTG